MASKKSTSPRHAAKTSTKSKKRKKPLNKRIRKWWNHHNRIQKFIITIAVFLVLVLLVVGIFFWHKLNMIGTKVDEEVVPISEEIDESLAGEIVEDNSLNTKIKNWAQNDIEKMSSKDVKNILLIGLDSVSGCTDSLILVSINTSTEKITLASFYRDSYTYISPNNKNASYGKLNWAYSKGGISTLLSTIENNYKIKIDDYALVNYSTFPKVIDALGGVNVYVTEQEAAFCNETWYEWSLTGNPQSKEYVEGENLLDGEMALTFCRVRRLDSDVNRTERQRRVISSVIDSMKNANLSKLNSVSNSILPYIKTSLSNAEIISLTSSAVANGWLKFEVNQTSIPTSEYCSSGWAGSQWIWIVDYEGAAFELQNLLYGNSNIEIEEGGN